MIAYSDEHGGQPMAFIRMGRRFHKSAIGAVIACGRVMPIKEGTNDSGTWFILEKHHAYHQSSWWEVITRCAQLLEAA